MINGWLTPNGNFIECETANHIEFFNKNKELIQDQEKIVKIFLDLELLRNEFDEISEREGSHNAEWHIYEIACDNARTQIWKQLLDNGFIRVGEMRGCLHFEGRPKYIKKRFQTCKDMADSYGAACVFEPVKN